MIFRMVSTPDLVDERNPSKPGTFWPKMGPKIVIFMKSPWNHEFQDLGPTKSNSVPKIMPIGVSRASENDFRENQTKNIKCNENRDSESQRLRVSEVSESQSLRVSESQRSQNLRVSEFERSQSVRISENLRISKSQSLRVSEFQSLRESKNLRVSSSQRV